MCCGVDTNIDIENSISVTWMIWQVSVKHWMFVVLWTSWLLHQFCTLGINSNMSDYNIFMAFQKLWHHQPWVLTRISRLPRTWWATRSTRLSATTSCLRSTPCSSRPAWATATPRGQAWWTSRRVRHCLCFYKVLTVKFSGKSQVGRLEWQEGHEPGWG